MKKHLSTILLALVFFVGLSVLLYPTVSNWWNSKVQSRAIVDYEAALTDLNDDDYEAEFAAADEYNKALREISNPLINYSLIDGYEDILDVTGTGIIGYLMIPKINVKLPIYHSVSDAVLNVGVGHLEGSSLPVGGEGTHAVLSAHRGLPSAKLFSDLDELAVGDIFTIKVLNRLLTYEISQIWVTEPEEQEKLKIEDGEDYCTLVTCTPYGINTHRLLVRGVRIEGSESVIDIQTEAYEIDSLTLAPIVAVPILFALFIMLLVKYRKKKG